MKNKITDLSKIEKEFWGVLTFELTLPGLFNLIGGKSMGIGLNRLSDWILFPKKIPVDHLQRIESTLATRFNNAMYSKYQAIKMTDVDAQLHSLLMELLRIKYSGVEADPTYFKHIFKTPSHMFMALMSQFIENGYITAHKFVEFNHYYEERKGQGMIDD